MSYTIEDEVVRMSFQNQQFEEGVSQSINSIEKLKKSLNFDNVKNSIDQVFKKSDVEAINRSITDIGNKFNIMQTIASGALLRIGSDALETGKKMLKALTLDPINTGLNEYETKMNAIQVIKSNTRGKNTMDEITDALNELNKYADLTIYNFQQMTSNVGKFVAQGMDVYKATNAIKGLANLAGASGASAQDMSRATYQMSQALGGTIRKIDWNSLRNANMATTQLKEIIKDVAKVEGKIDVDSLIAKEGNFEESLSKGWLTGDIFTEAMNMYSDAYTEAELKAKGYTDKQIANFKAVAAEAKSATTEVKTLSQLWDVIKETAQSGWTQTWEYILGSFEEVKSTLTSFNNMFSDIINKSADARNAVFKEWHDLGGRDLVIKSFLNVLTNISNVISNIKKAYYEVFSKTNGNTLFKLTERIYEFTKGMILTGESLNNIKDAFKGIFEVQKFINDTVGMLIRTFIPSLGSTKSFVEIIIGLLGKGGRKLSEIVNKIKTSEKYQKFIYNIVDSLHSVVNIFGTLLSYVGYLINRGVESGALVDITNSIANALYKVSEILPIILSKSESVISFLTSGMKDFSDLFTFENFYKIIDAIIQKVTQFRYNLAELLSQVPFVSTLFMKWKAMSATFIADVKMMAIGLWNFIKSLNATKIVLLTMIASFSALVFSIAGFFNNWGKVGKSISGLLTSFTRISDRVAGATSQFKKLEISVGNFFDRLLKPEKMNKIEEFVNYFIKIALAVTAVSASLALLASQPVENIKTALAAVVGMMIFIAALSTLIANSEALSKDTVKTAKSMFKLSFSVLLISMALQKLSDVSVDGLAEKTIALIIAFSAIAFWGDILATDQVKFKKGYHALMWMAGAVWILADAYRRLGTDTSDLGKKLGIVAGLFIELGVISGLLGVFVKKFTKGSRMLLTMSISVYILVEALTKIDGANLLDRTMSLIGVMLALSVFAGLLSIVSKKLITGETVMLALSASVLMLSWALKSINPADLIPRVGALLLIMFILSSFSAFVSSISKKILTGETVMLALSASMLMLSLALKAINPADLLPRVVALLSIMAVLSICAGVLSTIGKKAITGEITILAISASILILSKALNNLDTEHLYKKMLVLTDMLLLLSAFATGISFVGPKILLGSASLLLVALSIKSIGDAFKGLDTKYLLNKAVVMLGIAVLFSQWANIMSGIGGGILAGSLMLITLGMGLQSITKAFKGFDTEGLREKAAIIGIVIVVLTALAGLMGALPGTFVIGAAAILALAFAFTLLSGSVGLLVTTGAQITVTLNNIADAFDRITKVKMNDNLAKMMNSMLYMSLIASVMPKESFKQIGNSILTLAVGFEKFNGVNFEDIGFGFEYIIQSGIEFYAAAPGYFLAAGAVMAMVPALLAYSAAMTIASLSIAGAMLITNTVHAKEMAEVGLNTVKGYAMGIIKGAPAALDSVFGFFKMIVTTAEGVLNINSPSKVFETIGGFCILGLIKGIVNFAKEGVGIVIDVCRAMIDAALETFDINSPSKEFNYMGHMNVKGLVDGTEECLTDAEASGEALAASQIAGFEKSAKEFNKKANEIYSSVSTNEEIMAKLNSLVQEGTEESIRLAAALGTTWSHEGKITTSEMVKISEAVKELGDEKLAKSFSNQWHQSFAVYEADAREMAEKTSKTVNSTINNIDTDPVGTAIDKVLDESLSGINDKVDSMFASMPTQTIDVQLNFEEMMYGKDIKRYANQAMIDGISSAIKSEHLADKGNLLTWDKGGSANKEELKKRMESMGYKQDSNGSWYVDTHIKGEYETMMPKDDDFINKEDLNNSISGLGDLGDAASSSKDKVKSLNETLLDSISIFDEFSAKTDESASKLIHNMQSQLNGVNKWAENLASLKGKISDEMYDALRDRGTESYSDVNALMGASQWQRDYMSDLFGKQKETADAAAKLVDAKTTETIASTESKWDKAATNTTVPDEIGKAADKVNEKVVDSTDKAASVTKKIWQDGAVVGEYTDDLTELQNRMKSFYEGTMTDAEKAGAAVQNNAKKEMKSNKELQKSFVQLAKKLVDLDDSAAATMDTVQSMAESFMKANPQLAKFGLTAGDVTDALAEIASEMSTMKEEIANNVYDSIDIFEEFDTNFDLTGEKLLDNMHSQINAITQWADNLQTLNGRGISSELLSYLQELGPKGAQYVNAFVNMTDEQLKEANDVFGQKYKIGDYVADKLVDSYAETGRFFTEGFANGMFDAKGDSDNNAMELGKSGLEKLRDVLKINSPSKETYAYGQWFTEGFVNGVKDSMNLVDADIEALGAKANSVLSMAVDKTLSFSIGMNIARGLSNGIKAGTGNAVASAKNLCSSVIKTVKTAFLINSPSRLFEQFGMFNDQGLANGLLKYSNLAYNAGQDVAGETMEGFKNTMGLSSIIDWDDLNPVITPRLDLTNVNEGFRMISDMFKNSNNSINGKVGVDQNGISGSPITFNQYNNSPKSLDTITIYRNTKNMLSRNSKLAYTR